MQSRASRLWAVTMLHTLGIHGFELGTSQMNRERLRISSWLGLVLHRAEY